MRYVIRTAISHSHIKKQITTVGSHGCIINIRNLSCVLFMYLIIINYLTTLFIKQKSKILAYHQLTTGI